MKNAVLLALVCALPILAVEVDIFKEEGDPRVVAFTVPAAKGDAPVKSFVLEGNGNKYYSQALLISKYPNGNARWYRLLAKVPAGRYQAVPGVAPKGTLKNGVGMVGKEKWRAFTNHLCTVTYDQEPFAIRIRAGEKEFTVQPPEIALPDGTRPKAVLKSVAPFDLGPVQSGLEFAGEFAPCPAGERRYWRLRVTLWADSPFVGLEPLLGVALDQPAADDYAAMRAWKSASLRIAGKGPAQAPRAAIQWEDDGYETTADGRTTAAKGSLGVFDLLGQAKLVIPEMAERFPIGVASEPQALRVDLLPEITPRTRYANREKEWVRYFAIHTGDYVMKAGVEVSFPMYLALDPQMDAAKLLSPIPVGMPDVDELGRSGAWLNAIGSPDKFSKPYDPEVRIGLDAYLRHIREERWYGFMNYGDTHGERTWNWFNNEYDDAAVLLEQGLRYRNPDYFRAGLRAVRHQMEIDTVKGQSAALNGAVTTHCVGHTGGYYRLQDLDVKKLGGNPFLIAHHSNGHTRIRGTCMAFILTGDRRFRDIANATGNWIMRSELFTKRAWSATHREPGWALVNLTAIYWMNASPKVLKAAEELAWIVMSHAKGRGVAQIALQKHNCPPPPEGWNEKNQMYKFGALSFPTGYQAAGMYLVLQVTQDEYLKKALRDNLKATADYVKTRLYFPERKGFVHSPVPWRKQSTRNGSGPGSAMRNVLLIDALLTGDKESLEISRDTMIQMLTRREVYASPLKGTNPDDPGYNSVSQGLYFLPLTLELMRKLDLVMPEIKYDLSQRELWGGSVAGGNYPEYDKLQKQLKNLEQEKKQPKQDAKQP